MGQHVDVNAFYNSVYLYQSGLKERVGVSPIITAIKTGNEPITKSLILAGYPVNSSKLNQAPLYLAAKKNNHAHVVSFLNDLLTNTVSPISKYNDPNCFFSHIDKSIEEKNIKDCTMKKL